MQEETSQPESAPDESPLKVEIDLLATGRFLAGFFKECKYREVEEFIRVTGIDPNVTLQWTSRPTQMMAGLVYTCAKRVDPDLTWEAVLEQPLGDIDKAFLGILETAGVVPNSK